MPNGQVKQIPVLDPEVLQLLESFEGPSAPVDTGTTTPTQQDLGGLLTIRAETPVTPTPQDVGGSPDLLSREEASLKTMSDYFQRLNRLSGGTSPETNIFKIDPKTGLVGDGTEDRATQIVNTFEAFQTAKDVLPEMGSKQAWNTNLTTEDIHRLDNALGWFEGEITGDSSSGIAKYFDQAIKAGTGMVQGIGTALSQNPKKTLDQILGAHLANWNQGDKDIEEGRWFEGNLRKYNSMGNINGLGMQRIADLLRDGELARAAGEGSIQGLFSFFAAKTPPVRDVIRNVGNVVDKAGRTVGRTWARKTDGVSVSDKWAKANPDKVIDVTPDATGSVPAVQNNPKIVPKTLQQQANEYTTFVNRYGMQEQSRHFTYPSTYQVGGETGSVGKLVVGHTMGSPAAFQRTRKAREARIQEVMTRLAAERAKLGSPLTPDQLRNLAMTELDQQLPDVPVPAEYAGQPERLGQEAQLQLPGDVATQQIEAGFPPYTAEGGGTLRPEQAGLGVSEALASQLQIRIDNARAAGATLRDFEADPKNIHPLAPTSRLKSPARAGADVREHQNIVWEVKEGQLVQQNRPYQQDIGLPVNLNEIRPQLVPLYQKLLVQHQTIGNLPPTSQHLLTMLDGIFQVNNRDIFTPQMYQELIQEVGGDNLVGQYYVPLSQAREMTSILKGFLRTGEVGSVESKLGLPSGLLGGDAYSASQALTVFDKFLEDKVKEFEKTNPGITKAMNDLNTNTSDKYHILALQRQMHGGGGPVEGVEVFKRYGRGQALAGTRLEEMRQVKAVTGDEPFQDIGQTAGTEMLQAVGRPTGGGTGPASTLAETPEVQQEIMAQGQPAALQGEVDRLLDLKPFLAQREPTAFGEMLVQPNMARKVRTLMQTSPTAGRAMVQQWIHDLVGMNNTHEPLQFNEAQWNKFQELNPRQKAELLGDVTTPEALEELVEGIQTMQQLGKIENPIDSPQLVVKVLEALKGQPHAQRQVGGQVIDEVMRRIGDDSTVMTDSQMRRLGRYYDSFDAQTKLQLFGTPTNVRIYDDYVHHITKTTKSDFVQDKEASNKLKKLGMAEEYFKMAITGVAGVFAAGGNPFGLLAGGAYPVLMAGLGRWFGSNPKLVHSYTDLMTATTPSQVEQRGNEFVDEVKRASETEVRAIRDMEMEGGAPTDDAPSGGGDWKDRARKTSRNITWLGLGAAVGGREISLATEDERRREAERGDPKSQTFFEERLQTGFPRGGVRTQDIELPIQ